MKLDTPGTRRFAFWLTMGLTVFSLAITVLIAIAVILYAIMHR